jgi:hypothetical protein
MSETNRTFNPKGFDPGANCVARILFNIGVEPDVNPCNQLWNDIKTHWQRSDKQPFQEDIEGVEDCQSGNPDTWSREVLMRGIAAVVLKTTDKQWPENFSTEKYTSQFFEDLTVGLKERGFQARTD